MPDQTLAQRIKAKYPGQYDDLSDTDLEAKITAKFPGVYDDIPKTAASTSKPPAADQSGDLLLDNAKNVASTALDVAKGVAKGVGNTAYGLGKIVHDYTPIGRISDAIQPGAFAPANKPPELTPTNTAQKVGYHGEQIAEYFAPVGDIGKAAEAVKAGSVALAQTGSPVTAGVSAALAAVPGASAVPGAQRAAGALQESAEKEMAQALGATKEWAKAEAAKLAPQMLQRGIGGTRTAMLDLASATAKKVGAQLDAAYTTAAQAGQTVPSAIVAGNIQLAGDALKVTGPNGARMVIPGTERVVSKLDELAQFVQSMGPDIPVDKAAQIKRTWDRIVSKAGLFGPKAVASATDNADAWATREASGAFRQLLNTNPDIAALNKESAFWMGLRNVLKETEKRTQAQRGGLTDAIRGAGGAAAGATVGGPVGAAVSGFATQQISRLVASPWWKTTASAPFKAAIADALASGSPGQVMSAVTRAASAMPAQLQQAVAAQ